MARDVVDLARNQSSICAHVFALQGLAAPTTRQYLAPNVYYDSPENLHPCAAREMLFRIDVFGNRQFDFQLHSPPHFEVGLVIEETRKVIFPQGTGAAVDFEKAYKIRDLSILCLALAAQCAPSVVGETSWIEHQALGYQAGTGSGASYNNAKHFTARCSNAQLAAELYSLFWVLPVRDQKVIRLASLRLISSRRADTITDRAVDLRIALEIVLMHGAASGNSEIAHKIASRGAALLGPTPDDRLRAFQSFKKGYGATSRAVHHGEFDYKAEPVLKALDELIGKSLLAVIRRGGIPKDWDAFTLGVDE